MTTTQPRRTRRPMIEMEGVVADLRPQDYVDELGGGGWQRLRVGKLVHRLEQRDFAYDEDAAERYSSLPGIGLVRAERWATTPAHARIAWVDGTSNALLADCPVKYRRFAD